MPERERAVSLLERPSTLIDGQSAKSERERREREKAPADLQRCTRLSMPRRVFLGQRPHELDVLPFEALLQPAEGRANVVVAHTCGRGDERESASPLEGSLPTSHRRARARVLDNNDERRGTHHRRRSARPSASPMAGRLARSGPASPPAAAAAAGTSAPHSFQAAARARPPFSAINRFRGRQHMTLWTACVDSI